MREEMERFEAMSEEEQAAVVTRVWYGMVFTRVLVITFVWLLGVRPPDIHVAGSVLAETAAYTMIWQATIGAVFTLLCLLVGHERISGAPPGQPHMAGLLVIGLVSGLWAIGLGALHLAATDLTPLSLLKAAAVTLGCAAVTLELSAEVCEPVALFRQALVDAVRRAAHGLTGDP